VAPSLDAEDYDLFEVPGRVELPARDMRAHPGHSGACAGGRQRVAT
jgi:hypothetical protein